MTPIRLTSDEERKVPAALGLWGFNMVASDKVNMDRIPADLRMPGFFIFSEKVVIKFTSERFFVLSNNNFQKRYILVKTSSKP